LSTDCRREVSRSAVGKVAGNWREIQCKGGTPRPASLPFPAASSPYLLLESEVKTVQRATPGSTAATNAARLEQRREISLNKHLLYDWSGCWNSPCLYLPTCDLRRPGKDKEPFWIWLTAQSPGGHTVWHHVITSLATLQQGLGTSGCSEEQSRQSSASELCLKVLKIQ
jgi:hypothetical protein